MCLVKKLVGTRNIYIQYTYFNSYVYVDIYIGKNRSWHCTLHCTQCTLHCTQFVCLFSHLANPINQRIIDANQNLVF